MLKMLAQLLGDDAPVLYRYVRMAVAYGVLGGLTILLLVPALSALLAGDVGHSVVWLVVLIVAMLVCWLWRRQVERAGVRVGVGVLQGGRQCIGDHVATLPVGWFTPENTAWLEHVVTQGMMQVAQLPAHVFTPVINGIVMPVVLTAGLLALDWRMGLMALLALPVLGGMMWWTARLGERADQVFNHQFAQASQRMVEFAQAQSVLRAFQGHGGSTRLLEEAVALQQDSTRRLIHQSTLSSVLNAWTVQAVFAVLLVAGVWQLQGGPAGGVDMAQAIAVTVALVLTCRFIDPLQELAGYGDILRGARGQLKAAQAILAVQPLPEPAYPQAPQDASVELQAVRFRYAPDQPDILHDVSLRVAPGSMVALVGASGSGKTTLMRLVARFFDVQAGSVRVGGVDVRDMSSAQLAGQIGPIFQEVYLFQGTIADSIRVGKPDASDAEVRQAAQDAGVADIIARLPQGLDTLVGEGGARLSGGERQRIAIARALIKDAPILLVDEATAALDTENQAAIAATLARLRGRRTLIVIAHQLSTVAMADHIVVLANGRVAEQGTPAQLQEQGGLYARFLAQRQAARGWRIASPGRGGHRAA